MADPTTPDVPKSLSEYEFDMFNHAVNHGGYNPVDQEQNAIIKRAAQIRHSDAWGKWQQFFGHPDEHIQELKNIAENMYQAKLKDYMEGTTGPALSKIEKLGLGGAAVMNKLTRFGTPIGMGITAIQALRHGTPTDPNRSNPYAATAENLADTFSMGGRSIAAGAKGLVAGLRNAPITAQTPMQQAGFALGQAKDAYLQEQADEEKAADEKLPRMGLRTVTGGVRG